MRYPELWTWKKDEVWQIPYAVRDKDRQTWRLKWWWIGTMAQAWRGGIGKYPLNPEGLGNTLPDVRRRSQRRRGVLPYPEGWGGYFPIPPSHACATAIVIWRKINILQMSGIDQYHSSGENSTSRWLVLINASHLENIKMDLVQLGGLRSENTSHLEHYNLFFFLLQWLVLANFCIISSLYC